MVSFEAPTILLVEDNEADFVITREGLRESNLEHQLHRVCHGKEAMEFLRKQGDFAEAPTPDLILLDLNMPVMNGREVISEITQDPSLQHLPVVVLTTSIAVDDVVELHRSRINSYIAKPSRYEDFVAGMKKLGDYWFEFVELPRS